MVNNRIAHLAFLVFIFLAAALAFSNSAWAAAGGIQACQQGGSCTVGEFLYDDDYVPIATAVCSFTSRYPDGNLFVNSASLSAQADGWYAYDIAATGSAGLYRSQICCTAGSDYLCLDKSFEVATSSSTLTGTDVANAVWNATRSAYTTSGSFGESLQNIVPSTDDVAIAVWGYSGRTLSSFGSLIADIWTYSTRSMTTFGTLVADVWSNSVRTLTGAELDSGYLATVENINTATQSAVASIKGSGNKDLTDLNASMTSIQSTVDATQSTVNLIYADTQDIKATTSAIIAKWGELSADDIYGKVATISATIGTSTDSSSSASLFGKIAVVSYYSGGDALTDISNQVAAAANTISLVRTDLDYGGKSTTAYEDLQRVIGYVDTLETLIGTSSDASTASTLFGKIKGVQDKADLLTDIQTDIDTALGNVGSTTITTMASTVNNIKDQLTTVDSSTTFSTLINKIVTDNATLKDLRNDLLTMKAITQVNQTMLEKLVNKPIVKTFLLEGSVIFRSLIINPSKIVSQTVAYEYYLPPEVKKEDILEYDKDLAINYDSDKNQYYVSGDFVLAPSETKTVSVRVEDIWKISNDTIASLRKQADELYKPLTKTSYFGQAVTVKSDIDVALDKISASQKDTSTPEKKIRAYNDAQIELVAVRSKLDKLKDLVAMAGSAGSMMGFVGGAQTIAVWGMIIIMSAGFVFLAVYMKILRKNEASLVITGANAKSKNKQKYKHEMSDKRDKSSHKPSYTVARMLRFTLIFIAFGAITAVISGATVYRMVGSNRQAEKVAIKSSDMDTVNILGEKDSTQVTSDEENIQQASSQKRVKIVVPSGEEVDLYVYPLATSEIVTKIKSSQEANVLSESANWVKVDLDLSQNGNSEESIYTVGWVNKEFVLQEKDELSQESTESKIAYVNDTETGFLRVREAPGGTEIGKVAPGDTYPFVKEESGWVEIELENSTLGWVSKEYVAIKSKFAKALPDNSK